MIDIVEVAKRSGVPASTLRYYEELGLISSIGRRGLRRTFDQAVLMRLALIVLARGVGFSLEEIRSLFAPDGQPRLDRRMLAAKANELDAAIGKLAAMRDELRHAAACPALNHLECPNFQRRLEASTGAQSLRRTVIGKR